MARHHFVTGGAGFVGSHVVAALLARGDRVTVFDDLSTGHRAAVLPGADLVVGDLSDDAALEAAFAVGPFDSVFHFAALSLVGDSMRRPLHYLRRNIGNGLALIDIALRHGVQHFVLSSTAALFGRPSDGPIGEDETIDPGSPYGFGGSKDLDGTPCYDDCAGSGGGVVNPDFPRLIAAGDRSSDNPQASPRVVMNSFYWKPPFVPAREEDLLTSLLTEKIGGDKYPGDFVASANWPNVAPGKFGPINALSPKYVGDSVKKFIAASPKPPMLWVRGDADMIVGDNSFFDLGTLGKLGYVPGWPGDDIYPPQPMVGQTRRILEQYGSFEEVVIDNTAHSPFIEKPAEFMASFKKMLK